MMKHQRTWPAASDGPHFSSLQFAPNPKPHTPTHTSKHSHKPRRSRSPSSTSYPPSSNFSSLPSDILAKIAASFTYPDLKSTSLVCKQWRDALQPLREAIAFVMLGKKYKHGHGGVTCDYNKALESFLKGVYRGSTLAMVDAGLLYWEMGNKEEGVKLYRKAAEFGDPAGYCNLGISYLRVEPPNPEEAVKWLYKASMACHARAQYQLALCLHHGRGVRHNLSEAAKWYLKAAEGGYVRAMYNASLCYSFGEGLAQSHQNAKKWMMRAADRGHSRAQYEHGLALFSRGEMVTAAVYFELATRAGETDATNIRNFVREQLPEASRDYAMRLADKWRALPSR